MTNVVIILDMIANILFILDTRSNPKPDRSDLDLDSFLKPENNKGFVFARKRMQLPVVIPDNIYISPYVYVIHKISYVVLCIMILWEDYTQKNMYHIL